jgi:hypothetical protein
VIFWGTLLFPPLPRSSAQREAGDAQSKVDADLPLKSKRLQRYRFV